MLKIHLVKTGPATVLGRLLTAENRWLEVDLAAFMNNLSIDRDTEAETGSSYYGDLRDLLDRGVVVAFMNGELIDSGDALDGLANVGGGTVNSIEFQQVGVVVATRGKLNIIGAVSVVDEPLQGRVTVTIPSSGLSNLPPLAVDRTNALAGVSSDAARQDHKHDISVGTPVAISTVNGEGTASTLARSDHVHEHGSLPGGSLHAVATIGSAGFMSAADKTKLDGIATGATATPLTSSAPFSVSKSAAAVGVATDAARSDHKHDINTDTPSTVGTSNSEGLSTSLARADHVHAHGSQSGSSDHAVVTLLTNGFMSTADKTKLDGIASGATATPLTLSAPTDVTKSAASAGVATDAARSDHKHDVSTAAPSTVGAANVEGGATSLARSDHVHDHGSQAGGSLHAVATTGSAGFLSATDKTKLDNSTSLTSSTPANVTKATAAVGVATDAARADHKHDVTTAAPSAVGTSNSEGVATSLARSDHVHDHGNLAGGSLHALAVAGLSHGFFDSADKSKLDGIASGATATPLTSTAPVDVTKAAAVVGVSTDAARADHKHNVSTSAPSSVGTANSEGASTSLARADHVHAHGSQSDGTDHAIATVLLNGFMSTTDKTKLDGIASGATATPLGSAAPQALGTAAAGVATSASREDHVHAHGNLGGDTLHAVATTVVNGFLSASDKTKLDGVASGATATPLTSTAPTDVTKSAAVVGVATDAARSDHKHNVSTAAPSTLGTANSEGIATSLARSDHVHDHGSQAGGSLHAVAVSGVSAGFLSASDKTKLDGAAVLTSTAPVDVTKAAAAVGVATDAARADHKHNVSTATPSSVGAANSEGTATSLARSDHVHDHGVQAGGALHAAASTSVNGFMSSTDKTKLDSVGVLTSVAPVNVTKLAAVVGVSTESARADHKHDVTTAAPGGTSVATASADGSASSLARSDHVHQSNTAPVNVTKATAAIGTSGEPARADHKHDVSTAAPSTLGTANSEGTATSLARSDHVHNHGAQTDGAQHAVATTVVNGFMSAADKTKLDGVGESIRQILFSEVVADVSTSSVFATFVDLLTINITTVAGSKLLMDFTASVTNSTAANRTVFRLEIDGVRYSGFAVRSPGGGSQATAAVSDYAAGLAAGAHVVKVRWCVSGGTSYVRPTTTPEYEHASLRVIEVK